MTNVKTPVENIHSIIQSAIIEKIMGGIAMTFPLSTSANAVRDVVSLMKQELSNERYAAKQQGKTLEIAKFRDNNRQFGVSIRIFTPTPKDIKKFIVEPDVEGDVNMGKLARALDLNLKGEIRTGGDQARNAQAALAVQRKLTERAKANG